MKTLGKRKKQQQHSYRDHCHYWRLTGWAKVGYCVVVAVVACTLSGRFGWAGAELCSVYVCIHIVFFFMPRITHAIYWLSLRQSRKFLDQSAVECGQHDRLAATNPEFSTPRLNFGCCCWPWYLITCSIPTHQPPLPTLITDAEDFDLDSTNRDGSTFMPSWHYRNQNKKTCRRTDTISKNLLVPCYKWRFTISCDREPQSVTRSQGRFSICSNYGLSPYMSCGILFADYGNR